MVAWIVHVCSVHNSRSQRFAPCPVPTLKVKVVNLPYVVRLTIPLARYVIRAQPGFELGRRLLVEITNKNHRFLWFNIPPVLQLLDHAFQRADLSLSHAVAKKRYFPRLHVCGHHVERDPDCGFSASGGVRLFD